MHREWWRSAGWPVTATLLAGAAILLWYGATVGEIRLVWDGSATYQHGYAVLPLCLWLMWRERERILASGFAPAWSALLAVALAGMGWLVGELAAVGAIKHFALVAMLVSLVWTVWGHRAARAAVFPLAFMFFAVPFGDFLVPTLMHYTAEFTVSALRMTGIPVYREGLSFVIPSGHWSVVEACSGIRYLLASAMVGTLYAYLTYVTLWRRVAFVLLSFVMPLVANWLRAYMIVMLGHLSGNRIAVGVDHLIYGWVFFGIVIFAMFWIGGRWREDLDTPPRHEIGATRATAPGSFVAAGVAAALVAGLWLPLSQWLFAAPVVVPASLEAPVGRDGWRRVDRDAVSWQPEYVGASRTLNQSYAKGKEGVSLVVHVYADQRNGRKLLQWNNRLVADEGKRGWTVVEERNTAFEMPPMPAIRARIKGGAGYVDAWYWYVVDGKPTVSASGAKLSLLVDRLTRGSDFSAAVFVATDGNDERAAQRVQDFLRANAADIAAMLERASR